MSPKKQAPYVFPNTKEELFRLVMHNSGLSRNALFIAIYLVESYSEDVGYSKCSVRQLSSKTGLSTRTVSQMLNDIEASGEWVFERSSGRATHYFPVIDNLWEIQRPFQRVETPEQVAVKSASFVTFMEARQNLQSEGN